jgi:formamidopyrimidine-DNA glycosylase
MPELPEVETIKSDLQKIILGKKIAEVLINQPAVIREPSAAKFKQGIEGQTISKIIRRAKVLVLELSNGKALVIHLKMTGQLVYPGGGAKSRVVFKFSDGKSMDFNDQRLFAELRLLDDWRSLKFIKELGPEPFELEPEVFRKMLAVKKTRIKPLLLDQTFISGIGNLYAAEVLFRAKISPERPANSLTDKEKDLLLKSIKEILSKAIESGGSSIDDYVRLSGEKGDYVRHHRVYGRQAKPCFDCKTPIKRTVLGGRGTFFCPRCQN